MQSLGQVELAFVLECLKYLRPQKSLHKLDLMNKLFIPF